MPVACACAYICIHREIEIARPVLTTWAMSDDVTDPPVFWLCAGGIGGEHPVVEIGQCEVHAHHGSHLVARLMLLTGAVQMKTFVGTQFMYITYQHTINMQHIYYISTHYQHATTINMQRWLKNTL